jgi:hypothetical protein
MAATATTTEVEPRVETTSDVPYMVDIDGWRRSVMDVHAPAGGGPWPVAILYHPDPTFNTKITMRRLATHLAASGMVVFNVNWGATGRLDDRWGDVFEGQAPCIYWFAAQEAEAYGGDPTDISLVGFSGGATMATATAMFGGNTDLGCLARRVEVAPRRVVAFEGDFLLAPWWDQALRNDPNMYSRATVWAYIDTYDGAPIHFLLDKRTATADNYSVSGPGSNIGDFMALRDADGSLTADLAAIGALDDEDLDLTEFSTLFHHRLTEAGKPSSITWINDGVHRLSPGAITAIADLLTSP